MKKCEKCGTVMLVNNNIVFTSNPPQYQLYCPECGHTTFEYYENITLGDLGNHIVCPECEEKDKEILELKKEFILTRKAFKLACREIQNPCEYCSYATMPECCIETNCVEEKIKYFKQQAEREVENE